MTENLEEAQFEHLKFIIVKDGYLSLGKCTPFKREIHIYIYFSFNSQRLITTKTIEVSSIVG